MSSLVREFQRDIIQPSKTTTDLLRTAKLISIKLDLVEIAEWVDSELRGYKDPKALPAYRSIAGGKLEVLNPARGWMPVSQIHHEFPIFGPISELEHLSTSESVVFALPPELKYPIESELGRDIGHWNQQIKFSPVRLKGILGAVRDRLLDWSGELEMRGIIGENMSFATEEREHAHNQVFNIQHMTGIAGSVAYSSVQIYDYGSLHQLLKEHNVPQAQRNELENIIDELKVAAPDKRQTVLERAKAWITKNADFLGASISIVRKAMGLGD